METHLGEIEMEMSSQQKLFNHVRCLERLDDEIKDLQSDKSERKELAKSDGFDVTVIAWVMKRRKAGDGLTRTFDDLTAEYEEAISSQKHLQFSDTKVTITTGGKSIDTTMELIAEATEQLSTAHLQ